MTPTTDPILFLLSQWSEEKESQRVMTKTGQRTTPCFARSVEAEAALAKDISATTPRTIEGLTAALEYYESAFASADIATSNDLGLITLRQIAKGARLIAEAG